jgi:hypothetical protein
LKLKTIKLKVFLILLLSCSTVYAETDCTDNSNDAVKCGSPGSYASVGQIDQAFDFQEVNNSGFLAPTLAAWINLTTITIGSWIAPDTAGSDNSGVIISVHDGGEDGFRLNLETGNEFSFQYQWSGGAGAWRTSSNPIVYTPVWQHLAVSYNAGSTSNDPVFYYNGSVVSESEYGTPYGSVDSYTGAEIALGIRNITGSCSSDLYEFDGDIDETWLFNGILDSTDINDIMDNGLAAAIATRRVMITAKVFSDDLVVYFKEGS